MRWILSLVLTLSVFSSIVSASDQCSHLLTDSNIFESTISNYRLPFELKESIELEGTQFALVRAKVKYARETKSAEEVWFIINKRFKKMVLTIELPKAQQSVRLERIGSYSLVMGTSVDFYGESKVTIFDPYNLNTIVIPNNKSALLRLKDHYR